MSARLEEIVALLRRAPSAYRELCDGVDDGVTGFRPAPGAWSARDILGHLIHGERTDWMVRARIILEHGESKPFDPFDREAMLREPQRGVPQLVEEFAAARAHNLAALEALALSGADLERTGMHPRLGAVTLGHLLWSWAVHDLAHLAQSAEAMAKRYRDEIGPWRAFMPIVDRPDTAD